MNSVKSLLKSTPLSIESILSLLSCDKQNTQQLYEAAYEIKKDHIGNTVYIRGLIELTNICRKNCYYCGIRFSNNQLERYILTDEEILQAAKYAYDKGLGSIVIQGGEITNQVFAERIAKLIREIKALSSNSLGITLSLGEQSEEVYEKWYTAGAHRYLLRIETTNPSLYKKIHPENSYHSYEKRLNCLFNLRKIGYQVGTGVMIGLPFQTFEDLANDLLFMHKFNIDMCGMGPYIEHSNTPLYEYRHSLWPIQERFEITLKMIAILRILMPNINIAATTALQAIDPLGREKALKAGANIIMPNITPYKYRKMYFLYNNKPCADENADDCLNCLDAKIKMADHNIGYHQWGDSKHFLDHHKRL